jgi:HEAT repeat protein
VFTKLISSKIQTKHDERNRALGFPIRIANKYIQKESVYAFYSNPLIAKLIAKSLSKQQWPLNFLVYKVNRLLSQCFGQKIVMLDRLERLVQRIKEMGPLAEKISVNLLATYAKHSRPKVRDNALLTLGLVGKAAPMKAVSTLTAVLKRGNREDAMVRSSAIIALGWLGNALPASSVAEVVTLLKKEVQKRTLHARCTKGVCKKYNANQALAIFAASALGRIGSKAKSAEQILLGGLVRSQDCELRVACARALGRINRNVTRVSPSVVKNLLLALKQDLYARVSWDSTARMHRVAAIALSEIGPAAVQANKSVVDTLIEAALLVQANPNCLSGAFVHIRALGNVLHGAQNTPLVRRVKKFLVRMAETSYYDSDDAVYALARIGKSALHELSSLVIDGAVRRYSRDMALKLGVMVMQGQPIEMKVHTISTL